MIQTYRPDRSPRHLADKIRAELKLKLKQHKAELKRQQLAAPTSLLRSQIQQGQLSIQHIQLILDAASEKAQLREKLPNKLEKLPIIRRRRVKGFLLKLYNFLFKEQRTSQLNTIYALRELTQLTQQLLEQSQELVELPQALHAATADDITRLQQWLAQTDQRMTQIDQAENSRFTAAPLSNQPSSSTADTNLDAFYKAFAAEFKRDSEQVRDLLKKYLPLLREAGLPEQAQVLDIGCGHGEWLRLLDEHGYRGCGLDQNAAMVEHCQQAGLNAIEADVLTDLNSRSAASLDAITGFHLIEHLPFEDCVKLVQVAFRVLRPGGIILLETVNPGNGLGTSCNVDFDPTQCRPLPVAVLQFILKYYGFTRIKPIGADAPPWATEEPEATVVTPLNERFYGFMDYAVIGFKA